MIRLASIAVSIMVVTGCSSSVRPDGVGSERAARAVRSVTPGYVAVPAPAPFEIRLPSRSFAPAVERPDWAALFARPEVREVHKIVQFTNIPDDQTRGALEKAGITLGQPLTGRAYL